MRPSFRAMSGIASKSIGSSMAVRVVVHLAAFLHVNHPSATDLQTRRRHQRQRHRRRRRVRQGSRGFFVWCSPAPIAVYGHGRGEILDEASVPHPDTPYGHSKLQAERLVLDAPGGDGRPLGVVLRLAASVRAARHRQLPTPGTSPCLGTLRARRSQPEPSNFDLRR